MRMDPRWLIALIPINFASAQPPLSRPQIAPFQRDLAKLSSEEKQLYYFAQLSSDRLGQAQPLDALHAHALGRSARFFRNDRLANDARSAVLALLATTVPDATDPYSRHTPLPSSTLNRLAATAQLLLAIHELPQPDSSVLDQGEQLARFIARQQRADGSFVVTDDPAAAGDMRCRMVYPGIALTALMKSQVLRPAAWKVDAMRRSLPYFYDRWADRHQLDFVAAHLGAFAEAYLQSTHRDRAQPYADFCKAMGDWVLTQPSDARTTAALVDACRVARAAHDFERYRKYRTALEAGLAQLQDGPVQHVGSVQPADGASETLIVLQYLTSILDLR